MPDQLSIKELLQDPAFKAWMQRPPKLKPTPARTPPWILYVRVRVDGKTGWRKAEFETYPKAFNGLVKYLREGDLVDAAIHSKRQWFKPPVVRSKSGFTHYWPTPPGHRWCGYCRRPTVFKCFSKHHAMKGVFATYEPRCSICGLREAAVKFYHSTLRSRFA